MGRPKMSHVPQRHSTPHALAARVRSVARAIDARDEESARVELRLLAEEANRLACSYPFPLRPDAHNSLERRQRLKAESDPLGAIG